MYTGTDRRLFDRIEGEVMVRCSPEGANKEYYVTTKNISGGGMKISLLKKLAPGTILDLEIFRNNSNISARGKGEVVWIYPLSMKGKRKKIFEAGVKFLDLDFLYIGNLISDLEAQGTTVSLLNAIGH